MITLTIPGKPLGKQRPRMTNWGIHTPKKTVNYETFVKELFVINECKKLVGYLSVSINAYYYIPKSTSKKDKELMKKNILRPDKKPDLDNIMKIVCDALNGFAYDDDKQIIDACISKYYSDKPRVEITIKEI